MTDFYDDMTAATPYVFQPRHTDEFIRRALLDWQAGHNQSATARRFGIAPSTLASWRRYYGEIEEPAAQAQPQRPPDYAIFDWLFSRLPADGRWTRAQRDRWVAAYVAMIDLIIEVVDTPVPQEQPT